MTLQIKRDWNEYFYDEYGNDLSIRDGISAFEKIIEVEIIKDTLIHKNTIQDIFNNLTIEQKKADNILKQWFIKSQNGEKRNNKDMEKIYYFCATFGGRKNPKTLGILGDNNKDFKSQLGLIKNVDVEKNWNILKKRLKRFIYYYTNLISGEKITLVERMRLQNKDVLKIQNLDNPYIKNNLDSYICPLSENCFIYNRFPGLCPRIHNK